MDLLEFFKDDQTNDDAWTAFLRERVPPDLHDDAAAVRLAWAAFLCTECGDEHFERAQGAVAPEGAMPGTEAKLAVLAERASLGQPLFRDDDPREPD